MHAVRLTPVLGAIAPQIATAVVIALWVTGLLAILNLVLAIVYRSRGWKQVTSYSLAAALEIALFVGGFLFLMGVIQDIPYPLPPNLPINRAYIGAGIALGLGLLPVTLWHRVSISDLPKRIAEDGKSFNTKQANVRVRAPGEWIN